MRYRAWRIVVFLSALSVPLFWLYMGLTQQLGPAPGKVLVDNLGPGALILLLLTLSVTPLRRLSAWGGWVAVRRQLGLWCFTYVLLHAAGYLTFLLGLRFERLLDDLGERPYIIVGVMAFMALLLLALTSNHYSMRRLGVRWRQLHKLVYAILVLGLLHMLWIVRSDIGEWVLYALFGTVLLVLRVPVIAAWLSSRPIKLKTIRKSLTAKFAGL